MKTSIRSNNNYSFVETQDFASLICLNFKFDYIIWSDAIEQCRDAKTIQNVVSNLLEWLKSPENNSLRRAFTVWIRRVYMPARFDDDDMPEIETLELLNTMLAETIKRWPKQWMAEGMKKGIEKGKLEAAKSLLDILDVEVIAEILGLAIEQVEALKNDKIQKEPAQYAATKKKRKKK